MSLAQRGWLSMLRLFSKKKCRPAQGRRLPPPEMISMPDTAVNLSDHQAVVDLIARVSSKPAAPLPANK